MILINHRPQLIAVEAQHSNRLAESSVAYKTRRNFRHVPKTTIGHRFSINI